MITKTYINNGKRPIARVQFSLPDSIWADHIYLVGDFNDWHNSSHPLKRDRDGTWSLTLDLEVGRTYQFRYRCDGDWMNDSQADEYVQNPYGSDNSVVVTDPEYERA